MLSEFEKKVSNYIKANELFSSTNPVLLAVSGGADSTALLYTMAALKAQNILGAELLCAHINHQLRGPEADFDEKFVIAQAAKLNLNVTTKRLDVRGFARSNKLSIETAARKLRLETLLEIAKANSCKQIATAHQKNDNAETILHRLIRGTGFRGLGGIWPMRVFAEQFEFVRPLLCVRRDEIIEYLQQRKLKWRQDHTNIDCTYTRNFIRHRLLPALQKNCIGSLVEQLSGLSESARRFYKLVSSHTDDVWPKVTDCVGGKTTLDLELFLTESKPIQVELVRRSLANIGCGERELTQQHFEKILQLAEQNVTGRKFELPGGLVAFREYEKLIFCRVGLAPPISYRTSKTQPVILKVPGQITLDKFLINATVPEKSEIDFKKFKASKTNSIELFDLDKLKPPLVVRFRKPGDRFFPLGLGREKKVGKFLTAAKVPHDVREKILIVTDSKKVIWVFPIRICEQAKITDKTRKILQLRITQAIQ